MGESIIPWRETGHPQDYLFVNRQKRDEKAISREPDTVTLSSK
jgi:hypothetical protein